MSEDPNVHPDAERFGGWSWHEPSRGEHFRRCGFCGSIHPDDLAAEVWLPQWADRKYGWPHKFYVDIDNREPEALFALSSTWGGSGEPGRGEVPWDDLTAEQRALYERDHGGLTPDGRHPTSVGFHTRPRHNAKFYTIHLSDPAIDTATKAAIESRCGLRFAFVNGHVYWEVVR